MILIKFLLMVVVWFGGSVAILQVTDHYKDDPIGRMGMIMSILLLVVFVSVIFGQALHPIAEAD